MAVWDELRVLLTWLRDEQPGTLLEFPDPRYEEGQPPPFQIMLAPTAVAVAEDLYRRFGDSVLLTVGCLPYPRGRPPDRPLHILTRPPLGELLDPQEAEARLDGPATVRSGQTLHHGLLVRNLAGRELTIATNGQVTAVVVDPRTGKVIGGFAEAQHPIGLFSGWHQGPPSASRSSLEPRASRPLWATPCPLDHGASRSRSIFCGTRRHANRGGLPFSPSRLPPEARYVSRSCDAPGAVLDL